VLRPAEEPGPSLVWVDPLGVEWQLSDPTCPACFWVESWKGYDSPTYAAYTQDSPGLAGTAYYGSRALSREQTLTLAVAGSTRAAATARRRALIDAFAPELGVGTLYALEPDGTRRRTQAFQAAGLEGSTEEDAGGITWARWLLVLTSPDPYWYAEDVTEEFARSSAGPFLPLRLPFSLPSNRTQGATEVDNPSRVECWPVWRIFGPCTGATLNNNTTGRTLTLTATLAAGEWLEVDTRERVKTIRDQAGVSRFSTRTGGSALWPLPHGRSQITVTQAGAGEGSLVRLTYALRYRSA
jgi:hypothetical protein